MAVIDLDKCTLCGACKEACPFGAIVIYKPQGVKTDVSGYKNVWVFIEREEQKIASVSFELLGKARVLAGDLKSKVVAVFLGSDIKKDTQELIYKGADEVILVEKKELGHFIAENYANT
ncbi:MAG: electron transfer flavoprotein subunit alpha, partial [Deltaproteobacteria bacterium]